MYCYCWIDSSGITCDSMFCFSEWSWKKGIVKSFPDAVFSFPTPRISSSSVKLTCFASCPPSILLFVWSPRPCTFWTIVEQSSHTAYSQKGNSILGFEDRASKPVRCCGQVKVREYLNPECIKNIKSGPYEHIVVCSILLHEARSFAVEELPLKFLWSEHLSSNLSKLLIILFKVWGKFQRQSLDSHLYLNPFPLGTIDAWSAGRLHLEC